MALFIIFALFGAIFGAFAAAATLWGADSRPTIGDDRGRFARQ